MKKKMLMPIAGLTFLVLFSSGYAQTLVVKMNNGTENSRPINTIQNLTFPSGNLLLTFFNGNTEPYSLADVRSVVFISAPLAAEMPAANRQEEIVVYPNPAVNSLQLKGSFENDVQAKIFNVYGALVIQTDVTSDDNTIDISNLKPGMYFIRINNHTSKFFKI